ncbi:hypothetical protein A9Q97_03615, partial [Rhodospirillales bacterium 47_12_T64]
ITPKAIRWKKPIRKSKAPSDHINQDKLAGGFSSVVEAELSELTTDRGATDWDKSEFLKYNS